MEIEAVQQETMEGASGADVSPGAPEASVTRQELRPRPGDVVQLRVELLGGQELSLEERPKSDAELLMSKAHAEMHTNDQELDFFSVYFHNTHEVGHKGKSRRLKQKIFLCPGRHLLAQFSAQERRDLSAPWSYHYGVKFYVPDPNNSKLLKDDHSKFLYCLQVCADIRANRVRVDRETAMRLTALMLQGNNGDYKDTLQPGYYTEFPQFLLLPESARPENYETQLVELHRAKAGYTPAQTDAEFLSIAKDLLRYGEHLFLAKTRRHDRDEGCSVVTIGNGWKGISVYFEGKEDKDRLHLPWKSVAKLSFRRDKFHITYTNPGLEGDEVTNGKRKLIKTKFYTSSHLQAKRIWRNATEQHAFFHLESIQTTSNSLFRGRTSRRYSFKQPLNSARESRKSADINREYNRNLTPTTSSEDMAAADDWVVLPHPPRCDEETTQQQESQRVQVDFRHAEKEENSSHNSVIYRDKIGGSLALANTLNAKNTEHDFSLSFVDEDSKAFSLSVHLSMDPPAEVTLNSGDQSFGGFVLFNSETMPAVDVGITSIVSISSTTEQDGKTVSSAGQIYCNSGAV